MSNTTANRPGRPTGFRLKFTISVKKVRDAIALGYITGMEKMTIVNERRRSQDEIMEIIMANPAKITDATFMASIVTEKMEGGLTLSEIVEEMEGEHEVEIARVDIANFYDLKKEMALSYLSRNAIRDEG